MLILLVLLIIFFCKKCCCNEKCCKPDTCPVEHAIPAPSATNVTNEDSKPDNASPNNPITDNGASISLKLPDGNVLDIAKNTQEHKLFSFLNSADTQVEADQTKGWITLDKVRFETGKTNLTPDSEKQLKTVAAMMQFFNHAHLKIGGYTDNTGNNEINMRISAERAKVTAAKLVSMGVAANRVTHEGYGSQRPVCPANDSEDCRAANRRVDVKVTQK